MLAAGPLLVDETRQTPSRPWHRKTTVIAALSAAAILAPSLRFGFGATPATSHVIPLLITLAIGGVPLLYDLLRKLLKREFGSDLLGGISIITAVLLGEYLAGSIIVLMLAGGEALESYALRSASSVLAALAKRMPSVAHRKHNAEIVDVGLQDVAVGDTPGDLPARYLPGGRRGDRRPRRDGRILPDGRAVPDHQDAWLDRPCLGRDQRRVRPDDSHHPTRRRLALRQDPLNVMRESHGSPADRRCAGSGIAWVPSCMVALTVAVVPLGHDWRSTRFLAVLVIATPRPLLIAIPIAIVGSISLCARRAIIVKSPSCSSRSPSVARRSSTRTGTLTYGSHPEAEQLIAPRLGFSQPDGA